MTTIERFFQFIEIKNIRHTALEKELSLSNGYLGKMKSRKSSIGSEVIEKIINKFEDLNPEWLLTGNGNMLKSTHIEEKEDVSEIEVPLRNQLRRHIREIPDPIKLQTIIDKQNRTIELLQHTVEMQQQTILCLVKDNKK